MDTPTISVILNVYKRPHMLERQIEAVLDQTVHVHPKDIHVWYNESGVDNRDPKDNRINTYRCNWNTKFFGRFTIPLMCKSEYIAVFDDDNLPMSDWFKNCLETINNPETNGILGGTGVTILSTEAMPDGRTRRIPTLKTGWNGRHLDEAQRVDFVGQTWFFRKEWARYLWYEEPVTWDNGEDIMFSYLAQKHGGINTFVPPHPESNHDMWSTDFKTSWKEGRDGNASWRIKHHTRTRDSIFREYINNGWKTVFGL